jgi:hypothetical protein
MSGQFKKPDLNAPRFREKSVHMLCLSLFKKFKKKFPEHNIVYSEFKSIIKTYNEQLVDAIIEFRDGIELPESLGHIFIGSCPAMTKRINIDYKKSGEYGVLTQHRNWNSDNKVMKIFFTSGQVRYKIKNKEIWAFTANREFRRKASKLYVEDYTKYMYINNNKKISMLFKEGHNKMHRNMERNKVASEDYNEFDI